MSGGSTFHKGLGRLERKIILLDSLILTRDGASTMGSLIGPEFGEIMHPSTGRASRILRIQILENVAW